MKHSFMMMSLLIAVATIGCGSDEAELGSVAVLDLDEVAKRLGKDSEIADALKKRETVLNQQLAVVQTSFQNEINKKQNLFGDDLKDDETEELLGLQRTANLKLNAVRRKAQGNFEQYRQAVINQFREETKPIARQIAQERGLKLVLTKNDLVVLSFDSVIDITDEVIALLAAKTGKKAAAKKPAAADTKTPAKTASKPAKESNATK